MTDLVIDNDTVYASAEGAGTFDGRLALNPDDGELRWVDNCRGATQALTPSVESSTAGLTLTTAAPNPKASPN